MKQTNKQNKQTMKQTNEGGRFLREQILPPTVHPAPPRLRLQPRMESTVHIKYIPIMQNIIRAKAKMKYQSLPDSIQALEEDPP